MRSRRVPPLKISTSSSREDVDSDQAAGPTGKIYMAISWEYVNSDPAVDPTGKNDWPSAGRMWIETKRRAPPVKMNTFSSWVVRIVRKMWVPRVKYMCLPMNISKKEPEGGQMWAPPVQTEEGLARRSTFLDLFLQQKN
jgi:hypothetical protein